MNIELRLAFRLRNGPAAELVHDWCRRAGRQRTVSVIDRAGARPLPRDGWVILCDPAGQNLSTEQMADEWQRRELASTPVACLLIGGADGWPGPVQPDCRWAFGRITMPHELAAAVASEQIYRILTILAGHPYHVGH